MTTPATTLSALLDGSRHPGVLPWPDPEPLEAVRAAAQDAGWAVGSVTGRDKATLLADLAGTLSFEDWFGHNYDALADSLADLAVPTVLVWTGWETIARDHPDDFATFLAVLADRARVQPPFAVLLPR